MWQTGATSVANLSDPVDFAKAAAETTAGLIGVKVWLVYRKGAVNEGSFFDTRLKAPLRLGELLAMPRSVPVRASSSAWWATPGPLQPAGGGAGRPYKRGVDSVALFGGGGGGGGAGHGAKAAAVSGGVDDRE
jgi:hypothetical protein